MSNIVLNNGDGVTVLDSTNTKAVPIDGEGRGIVNTYEDIANIRNPYLYMRVIVRNDSQDGTHLKGEYIITSLTNIGKVDVTGIKSFKEYVAESDPNVPAHVKAITQQNITDWNGKQDAISSTNTLSPSNIKDTNMNGKLAAYDNSGVLGSSGIDTANIAVKSDMSITDGTGADAGTATIQLKTGTSKKVLTEHQNLDGKVDKVPGKELSTNDYDNIEKGKVANAIQTPNATENDKIPVMREGNIVWESKPQDGAQGPQGEAGHNPCLGRLNNIPADFDNAFPDAIAGDYVYVDIYDSTTQTTTTTVYHYQNDTDGWDNGTIINADNPTFTSGQEVTGVAIKDLVGNKAPNAQGVLDSEQGKVLEGKLFKYVNLTPTLRNYNIDFNNPTKVGTNSTYKHYLLAVNAGETYYIGGSNGSIYYAFLSQEPQGTSGETLVFATGYSSAILLRPSSLENGTWKTAYITIPEGCTYLWVDASGTPSRNVSRKREDKFVTEENISFDFAKKEVLVTNESFNRYILDGVNRWNKQTITAEYYSIDFNTPTKVGSNNIYKHYLIAVQAGDVVCMATSYHSMDLQYALLTTNEGLVEGADLPLVTGTSPVLWSRTTDTSWVYHFVEIPEGCAYIWIDCKGTPSNSNTRCYKSSNRIKYTDVIEESTDGSLIPSVAAVKSYAASNETINNTNTDNATKSLSAAMGKMLDDRFKKWIFLKMSYYFSLPYNITADGKLGTNTSYIHALLNVKAGDEYIIRCIGTINFTYRYCFLTTKNFENTANASLPIVEGTSVGTYYTANQEVPQEKYIVIPDGCNYLMFDFSSTKTRIFKRIEKDNYAVPNYYQNYIKAKAEVVLDRDIERGITGDSFIFFSDYHVNDSASYNKNYGHSPSLIKYLIENTNTKKVFFGGDVVGSPGDEGTARLTNMKEFIRKFSDIKIFPVNGNHEWGSIDKNYNSLIKPLENYPEVHFGDTAKPWYYIDNNSKKIRYVCLYAITINAPDNYTQQLDFLENCCKSLTSDWKVVVMQHIVYQTNTPSTEVVGRYQQATSINLMAIGQTLIDKIKNINQLVGPNDSHYAKIVLVLTGHAHADYGEYIDDNCYIYLITCDASYALTNSDASPMTITVPSTNRCKLPNTIFEQSVDAVHIVPDESLIIGERVGWGRNRIVHTDVNTVSVGNTITLEPTINSSDIIGWDVVYKVGGTSCVTVSDSGVVTPITEGDATIICYTAMVNEYDENTQELEKDGYVEYFHVKVTNGLD